jgi:bacterioferritin-associated ferredoxin
MDLTQRAREWTHVERLRAGYCEHTDAPSTYEGPTLCGDCTEAAADALQEAEADLQRLRARVEAKVAQCRHRVESIQQRPAARDEYYDGQRHGQASELAWCADELLALLKETP